MAEFTTQVTNPDGTITEIATELVNPDGTPNYQAILALLRQPGLGGGLQGSPEIQALMQQIAQLASQQGQPPPPQTPAQTPPLQTPPAQEPPPPGGSPAAFQHGNFGATGDQSQQPQYAQSTPDQHGNYGTATSGGPASKPAAPSTPTAPSGGPDIWAAFTASQGGPNFGGGQPVIYPAGAQPGGTPLVIDPSTFPTMQWQFPAGMANPETPASPQDIQTLRDRATQVYNQPHNQ